MQSSFAVGVVAVVSAKQENTLTSKTDTLQMMMTSTGGYQSDRDHSTTDHRIERGSCARISAPQQQQKQQQRQR